MFVLKLILLLAAPAAAAAAAGPPFRAPADVEGAEPDPEAEAEPDADADADADAEDVAPERPCGILENAKGRLGMICESKITSLLLLASSDWRLFAMCAVLCYACALVVAVLRCFAVKHSARKHERDRDRECLVC